MVEKGVIDSIKDGIATILCSENPYCASCKACEHSEDGQRLKAKYSKNLRIAKGDIVEVYISTRKSIFASFMVFIVPIILFFLFYILAVYVIKTKSEPVQVFMGFGGIVFGFIVNLLYGKLRKDEDLPVVTKILTRPIPNEFYAELVAKNER
ncbi:MAG: hypothetical protein DRP57_00185 [Spirochaetes bacterium]|nr:MAG: hypothetical protein DRP57_00185 [Spirochaetota bacterium]